MASKFDEDRLSAVISREIADARIFHSTDIEKKQRRALDYYEGRLTDTPAEEGWSSVVSKDASDVLGWALPGVVRVFTASDRIVDFQPMERGDEDFTDQSSDTINYDFWASNGYRVIWDATHDSLLLGDGIVKTWWDDTKRYKTSELHGLTEADIGLLQEDEELEITEQRDGQPYEDYVPGEPIAGPDGQMMPGEPQLVQVPTFDVKVRRVTSYGRLKFRAIERGNFFIDRDATCMEEARFCCQRDPRVTRSELVEMGFDLEKVKAIPRYDGTPDADTDELTRRYDQPGLVDAPDEATEFVELNECYIRLDINGDGIAELVRVYFAGNAGGGTILEWEEFGDDVPFDQIPCTPVPHRFDSDSLAGDVLDIQQIKTALLRQGLNNAYSVNNPQKDVEEDSILNLDELVNPTPGGVLERRKGSPPVNYNVVPSIMPSVLETIALMDRIIEWRTGISRSTMSLDPEGLQNTSATASQLQHDAAYSQVELIARNMAELGWKNVFKKALRLTVKHQTRARTIRLRDEWVDVDPRYWNSDMDAVVNTGLGTGSRDRDLVMLQQVRVQQQEIAAALESGGMGEEAVDMMAKLIRTSIKAAEAAGLRNAADFFPKMDEETIAKMKQRVAEQAGQEPPELQMQREKDAAELQMKQQKTQSDAMLQQQKLQMETQLEREKMAMEAELKREQMAMEFRLRREQMMAELQLQRETRMTGAFSGGTGISPVQLGGDLG